MSELGGMTVNERIYHVGLLDQFEAAILAQKQVEAISILQQVELSKKQAAETVAAISKNPGKYGYT